MAPGTPTGSEPTLGRGPAHAIETAGTRESQLDVTRRLLGFYRGDHPAIASLASLLDEAGDVRDAASPANALVKAIGLAPPATQRWYAVVVLSGKAGVELPWFSPRAPYAKLTLNSSEPLWELEIHPHERDYQKFADGETLADGFGLKPPRDLVRVREYLDDAAKTLRVRWQWATASTRTNLRGKAKTSLERWARDWKG